MYIKSVILDGFKSYGKRTEIKDFDPEFTAITGLNGTGKSNILDSICFVLGISKLDQVRATSLQELVYKNGQAGITKASVTIVFDNSDGDNCPLGYEKCKEISVTRQVIVGGKNKYWINGKVVLNKKVTDLFCAVQMNVNNPNFLIMQGRITKVLNMKPIEILSMIEEAAGTSLYEVKRDQTNKTIEKKDPKLKEVDTVLAEEVRPRIEKLREEQAAYAEFQKVTRDIDHLTHIHISFTYMKMKKNLEGCETGIAEMTQYIENSKKKIEDNIKEGENIDQQCKEMQEAIDGHTGGELADMEKELTAKTKAETTANAEKKSAATTIEAEKRKLKTLERNIGNDEKALAAKNEENNRVGGLFQQLKEADEGDRKAYAGAQQKLQAISSGLATTEGGETASLQEQLNTAKKQLSEATTTIKKSEMELNHNTKLLNEKQGKKRSSDASYLRDKQQQENLEQKFAQATQKLGQIEYTEGSLEDLEHRKFTMSDECRQIQQALRLKDAGNYELNYQDPEPGFDRTAVKGMLCNLFEVIDPKHNIALSACAGGMLRNMVVDNEITSKKILQNGRLQTRTTIIPISKIVGGSISPQIVEFAQRLVGRENCIPAMDCIRYDPSLEKVMRYAFGRVLICKDTDTANKVTFHPKIHTKTITLDGDVFDPEGILSGGAREEGADRLGPVAEIKQLKARLQPKYNELKELNEQIAQLTQIGRTYNKCKDDVDAIQIELDAIKARLAQTSFQKHQQEIEDAKAQIANLNEVIANAREAHKQAGEKIKEVQANLSDAKGYRERQLKEAEADVKRLKKKSEESGREWKKREQDSETLTLEIEELKKSIEKSKEDMVKIDENINDLKAKLDDLTANGAASSAAINELKAKIKEQKDRINSQHRELRQKMSRKDKMLKQNDEITLEIKKKENELKKLQTDNADEIKRVENLEKKYTWIETDREYFGVKNTKYDYTKEDPAKAGEKLRNAMSQREKMEKRINVKAMQMLQREEEQLREISDRKGIVEDDKTKIKNILRNLDAEKIEQVRVAWKEVDKNFASIFSMLLPGAQAALVPTFGNEFHKGLNIRVGFNGVWKESLNELSGGQRSLVALSLILAMLKFKPAPIYILDEVDAALDMSHTQNIGQMLKIHFTNSQFIIVSLKDGMFNNANVLYKTRFENGVSAVTRTSNLRR